MFFAGLKLLSILIVLVGPTILAGRKFGMASAFGALGVTLILTGVAGLMSPASFFLYVKLGLALSVLAWAAWVFFAPDHWLSFMQRLMGSSSGSTLVILLFSTVVPLGNLEWLAFFGSNMGFVEAHSPMTTRITHGVEDWRDQASLNNTRVQDPVLFWRPKPGIPPYSAQGFKTTIEMEIPKPANVFRIMTYGDSNTEGGREGDWTLELYKLLQRRNSPALTYELVNAGVAGYSSYQGVQRFLEEWEEYQPDLILVSFGWNDLPEALDQPDKAYEPNSALMVQVLRILTRYRTFQVIQHYLLSDGMAARKEESQSRVPLEDYLDNMRSFSRVGKANDIEIVFLTRPYRARTVQILKEKGWRSGVPGYNQALSSFAEEEGEYLVDVQAYFENETTDLFIDETHFTKEGITEMSHYMVRELDRVGLLPDSKGK